MASTWQNRWRALTGGKQNFTVVIAHAPKFVSVVLGLAIVSQAAAIALSLSAAASAAFGARITGTTSEQVRAKSAVGLDSITAAHLFGVAPQAMTAANIRAAIRSPLVLTGIIATSDPHVGYAILGSSATSTRTVYAGREAAPGTLLAEVYPQWVVLLRGGERVTLRLPRKDAPTGLAVDRALAMANSARDTEDDGESDGVAPTHASPPPMTDGAAVLHAFALRRTMIDGRQGERIGTSLNNKALAALSLSPGDVIVQINGVPVGARNAPDLMSALQSGSATLMVVKDGQETSVTIDPNSMADAASLIRQTQPDL
jgi:type II secretory pathway component PulC